MTLSVERTTISLFAAHWRPKWAWGALLLSFLLAACGGGGGVTNHAIGGSISGLSAAGLVLANGSDTVTPASGATTFTFAKTVAQGDAYAVTVQTQPAGETCAVTLASGTMASADVSNVQVTCTVNKYSVGGVITGLTSAGLVLANGSDNVGPVAGALGFTFGQQVATGGAYAVTVATQPVGATCSVSSGSGTVTNAAVSSVAVTCVPVGVTVTSITPTSGIATTVVTITGTNFKTTAANDAVTFNGVAATVQSATATTLTVVAPVSTTGAVTVSTSDGAATGPTFTYIPVLTIASINPTSATAGSSITITGTNFDAVAANNTVKFNGVNAVVSTASTTQLVVIVPATGTTGNITVTSAGSTSNGIAFTYITGPAIYTAGERTNGDDGYWVNSIFNKLGNAASYPWVIAGSGADIYVAGPIASSPAYPTYWKNSAAVQLSNQAGGYLTSIFIAGTDVYCLGTVDGQAINTWKNGVASTLSTTTYAGGAGFAKGNSAMFVTSSGDVYVAGFQSLSGNPWYWKATYWKNGVPADLTNGVIGNAQATAVFVSGADVYVAGYEEVKSGAAIVSKAPRLWKNGISVPLAAPVDNFYNSVNALLVAGSDVYVGGVYNGAGAVWKNGVMINAAAYAVAEQVTSLFLYNNTDLYASGSSNVSGMNGYWVNGSFVEMDPGCTKASSICAATSANQVRSIYVK